MFHVLQNRMVHLDVNPSEGIDKSIHSHGVSSLYILISMSAPLDFCIFKKVSSV